MSHEEAVTANELDILRHSLGLTNPDARGREYRNYFVAGGDMVRACRALAARGLMVESSDLPGINPLFHVTEEGKRVVRGSAVRP